MFSSVGRNSGYVRKAVLCSLAPVPWGSSSVFIASLERKGASDGRSFEAQEKSLGFALLESLEVTEERTGVMKYCFAKITLAGVCRVKEKRD